MNNKEYIDSIIDSVEESLIHKVIRNKNSRKRSSPNVWVIYINGELFMTDIGKCFWKAKNHATCALRNNIECYLGNQFSSACNILFPDHKFSSQSKFYDLILPILIERGFIEIKEVKL